MSYLKALARNFVFPLFIRTGLEKILSVNSKSRNLILMYHGVVKKADPENSVNHLSVDDFERNLIYLKKNFEIVSLTDILKEREGNGKGKLRIAITFDDGYENNYLNAYPLLKKYNIPATIFVVSKCLEEKRYILWYDLIDFCKSKLPLNFFKQTIALLHAEQQSLLLQVRTWGELKDFLKKIRTSDKEIVLQRDQDEVKKILDNTPSEFVGMLTPSQMKEMVDSGLVEIGSHTHNHPNLSQIDKEQVVFEVSHSKKILELATGKIVKSIAFPDGSYDQQVKDICLKSEYTNLLAVDFKLDGDNQDSFISPRFCISNTTTPESNFIQIHKAFLTKGF